MRVTVAEGAGAFAWVIPVSVQPELVTERTSMPTLELVRASLPDHIEMRTQLAQSKGITVLTDPTHVHQVVMNLCTNAIHAMPAGGVLSVDLDGLDLQEDRHLSHGDLPAGRYVRLLVQDSGCGMEAETLQRIFEPFHTRKTRGTGLGLSMVRRIVAQHGGTIDAHHDPPGGAVVRISRGRGP